MIRGLDAPELLIIAVVVLALFAGPRLPGIARSLGASLRILRDETRHDRPSNPDPEPPERGA